MFREIIDKVREPVGKVSQKVQARVPFKKGDGETREKEAAEKGDGPVSETVSEAGEKLGGVGEKASAAGEKVTEKVGEAGEKAVEKVGGVGAKVSAAGAKFTGKLGEKLGVHGPFKALEKDTKLGRTLHSDVIAALNKLQEKHPDVKEVLEKAYGYAVLPSVGRASLVLGGAYGVGEVFVKDRVIGYAAIIELTIGVQVGGTTFHELIVFNDEKAWKELKDGKYAFAADAGVAFVKAAAQVSKGFGGNTAVFVFNEGGMLLDLAIGLQKFTFKPSAVGRLRTSEQPEEQGQEAESAQGEGTETQETQPSGSSN